MPLRVGRPHGYGGAIQADEPGRRLVCGAVAGAASQCRAPSGTNVPTLEGSRTQTDDSCERTFCATGSPACHLGCYLVDVLGLTGAAFAKGEAL
jgi:hypothetical protein